MDQITFNAWLKDRRNQRIILIEFSSVRCANAVYISWIQGTPYSFLPLLIDKIELDDEYGESAVGDLMLANNGDLDYLLNQSWTGEKITIKVGDKKWDYDEFQVVVSGRIQSINASSSNQITLAFYDQSIALDKQILADKTTENEYIALVLGNVFNVEIQQKSALYLDYYASIGHVEAIDIRDRGVSVSSTLNNNIARLSIPPAGELRADIVNNQIATLPQIIEYLASLCGFDSVTYSHMSDWLMVAKFGLQITGDSIVSGVLDDLLQPLGLYYRISPVGQFQILHINHNADADHYFTRDDIVYKTLQHVEQLPPASVINVHYGRNWGTQSDASLAGLFDADSASSENLLLAETYKKEWKTLSAKTDLDDRYFESVDYYTLLINKSDAQQLLDEKLQLRSVRHDIWSMDIYASGLTSLVADRANIKHPRYNFEQGVTGTIIKANKNIGNTNRVQIEVLI